MVKKFFLPIVLAVSFNTALVASEWLRIAGTWTLGAVGYAALFHNQITRRLSPQYFSGEIQAYGLENMSPTKQAVAVGINNNLGLGLLAGAVVATAARAGSAPQLSLGDTSGYLLGSLAFTGLGAGVCGYLRGWNAAIMKQKKADIRQAACGGADFGAQAFGAVGVFASTALILLQRNS